MLTLSQCFSLSSWNDGGSGGCIHARYTLEHALLVSLVQGVISIWTTDTVSFHCLSTMRTRFYTFDA